MTDIYQSFTYKMAAKINWHRHGTKLSHLHRYVYWNFETEIFNSLACTLDTLSAPSCSTVYFWRMFTLRDMNAILLSRTLHKVNIECNAVLDDCSSPQFSHRVRRSELLTPTFCHRANIRSDIGPSSYGPPRPWVRSGHWADRNPVEASRAYFPTPGT